jgi:hypothetical protein
MAGWNPTLDNIISVCIRLQEYPEDVSSQFKHHQISDREVEPHTVDTDGKDAQDDDVKQIPDEIEFFEAEFGFKSSFNIDCERNKSVMALKERIFDATGYSANSQKLLYIGR